MEGSESLDSTEQTGRGFVFTVRKTTGRNDQAAERISLLIEKKFPGLTGILGLERTSIHLVPATTLFRYTFRQNFGILASSC